MRPKTGWRLLLLGLAAAGRPGWGAFPDGFNHPELTFRERRTEHFQFIYQTGLEQVVAMCGEILERVYEPICQDLQVWPPEPTPVVLTDYDDVGRNFSVRLEHRLYISQPVVNQARLGRRDWLQHLLAHEFAHVVNYWALRRAYREWGEWAGMELQPQWFTEGLAEYEGYLQNRQENSYALRAAQERLLLPLGKMDLASNRIDLVETWLLYAQGHSLVLYLVETYGEDVLRRLLDHYTRVPVFEVALQKTIGQGQRELFREWVAALLEKQARLPAPNFQEEVGQPLPTPLVAALSARWSPDGRQVAVFGIENWEEPVPGIYLMEADGKGWRRLSDRVDLFASPRFSWSPDSTRLAYVGREQTRHGAVRNAIYVYDQRTGAHRRVTGSLRVTDPDWSPTGEWLALVLYEDETTKLALIRPDGSGLRRLTDGAAFQVFQPSWAPTGDHLAVCLIDDTGMDVAILDLHGKIVRRLTADPWPDQYPAWSPGGQAIAFVSYRGEAPALYSLAGEGEGLAGIAANLFCIGAEGSDFRQVTRAGSGGIFYPTWLPDGKTMAVSLFRTRNADLRLIPVAGTEGREGERRGEKGTEGREGTEGTEGDGGGQRGEKGTEGDRRGEKGTEGTEGREGEEKGEWKRENEKGKRTLSTAASPQSPISNLQSPISNSRSYQPSRDFRRILTRPLTDEDGVGDTFGVRTFFTDPLRQHNLTVETGYGLDSEEYNYRLRYENDETRATLGLEVFQRVDPADSLRGGTAPDRAQGVEIFSRFPMAPSRSPWIKDVFSLGFEMADRKPLLAVRGTQVNAVTARWERNVWRPNRGSSTYLAHLTRADTSLGSDVDFTEGNAVYVQRWQVPDLRRLVSLGLEVRSFDGENLARTAFDRRLFLGTLRYDWRFADQLYERAWPYAYLGRAWLSASYEGIDVFDGETEGIDPRDRVTLEFRNVGWITRGLSYEARLGQRFFMEEPTGSEFFSEVSFDVRELGF